MDTEKQRARELGMEAGKQRNIKREIGRDRETEQSLELEMLKKLMALYYTALSPAKAVTVIVFKL